MTWKPGRGWIKELEPLIPLSKDGDPAFSELEEIREVFTDEMLVYIVNKYLYSQTYNREYHSRRAKEQRAVLRPVKLMVHKMFGVSYLNATPEQIDTAIDAVRKEVKRLREER